MPATYDCVASGVLAAGVAADRAARRRSSPSARSTRSPPRSRCAISRSSSASSSRVGARSTGPASASKASAGDLSVEANPRQVKRGAGARRARPPTSPSSTQSLIGDVPYPTFTLAVVESDLPGGHSPGVLRALNQPLPMTALTWRNDPAAFERFPGLLPRPRARAPVVGTGGRLAQLPRAVAQRGVRAVLRGALRAASARRRGVRERAAADAPVGDERIRSGAGLPRLPARSHPGRRPHLPRARLQQGRGRAAHAAAAGRRRGVLRRPAPLLRRVALPQGRHRRVPAGDGSGGRAAARSLLRAVDLRVDAAAAEGRATASKAPRSWSTSSRSARSSTCRSP